MRQGVKFGKGGLEKLRLEGLNLDFRVGKILPGTTFALYVFDTVVRS